MSLPSDISDQDWLYDPSTEKLLKALMTEENAVRFVGGCVRNAIMGEGTSDLDLATIHEPLEVMRILGEAKIKVVPTGLLHGTVTAVVEGKPFEITTLRADVETDGRRAKVAFSTDWEEDARRRDFTMNAIYADADGTLFDPLNGMQDVHARVVRFIGDPAERISEDYLRILRFFRFNAHYGQGVHDEEGLKACAEGREGLKDLSGERIQTEMLKLLSASKAIPSLMVMKRIGVLDDVLKGLREFNDLSALIALEERENLDPDPILRLATLIHLEEDVVQALSEHWKFSNAQRGRLSALTQAKDIDPNWSDDDLKKSFFAMGHQETMDRVISAWAGAQEQDTAWRHVLTLAQNWQRPDLPLTGQDILDLGVEPGPEVGALMRKAEAHWLENNFAPTKDELIAHLDAGSK